MGAVRPVRPPRQNPTGIKILSPGKEKNNIKQEEQARRKKKMKYGKEIEQLKAPDGSNSKKYQQMPVPDFRKIVRQMREYIRI